MDNIVLVTIDSLRADHCGFMGYAKGTTPAMNRLADAGTVFENAIAPGPSTSESMPAIFTGSYPARRDLSDSSVDPRIEWIRPHMQARTTLAERMSALGYSTAAFTPNPFTSRYFGYDTGFDHYMDFLDGSRDVIYERLLKGMLRGGRFWMPIRIALNWIQGEEAFKPWESFYDEVMAWADQASEPYFIWVFLMDVHHPYLAGDGYRTHRRPETYYANWKLRQQDYEPPLGERTHAVLVDSYDDSIRYADAFIERIQDDLEADDPTVVVTADHGEAFGEHGTYEHHGGAFGQHGEQEYHSYLYEENIHVPLVVGDDQSRRVSSPVSLRSLPTVLENVARERDNVAPTSEFVCARTMEANRIAVRGKRFKYIRTGEGETVYDLRDGESDPINNEEVTSALRKVADRFKESSVEQQRIVDAMNDLFLRLNCSFPCSDQPH